MDFLSRRTLQRKGYWFGLVNKNEDHVPEYLAYVWLDRDRRYFIATTSSLAMGDQVVRDRLHQLVKDKETPPERTEVNLTQPRATQLYYECAAKIDQHNRDCHATLGIERKLVTHNWAKRVNISILFICLVDAWKIWSLLTVDESGKPIETQKEFYGHLAAEFIDNNYDGGRIKR
jgi:hypothetical protein